MLEPLRSDFNARYTDAKYSEFLSRLQTKTRTPEIGFRVAETPCFLPKTLLDEMTKIGAELTQQLVGNTTYLTAAAASVPEAYRVPGDSPHPHFMTVDFGLVRGADGALEPKLVELQAFPSLFGYQDVLAAQYIETYELDPGLRWLLSGLDEAGYWNLLSKVILSGHHPENVILTEVDPENQKTRADFCVYEDRLGIRTVDIAMLRKEGRRLFYQRDGAWTPVARIYNRAIVDEMERKQVRLGFDYRDDLEVEWAGHPNWYFQISKFSLPFLNHRSVPETIFLDDWFREMGTERLHKERERTLLKPLYSFAGRGISFAPSDEELRSIPEAERHLYLMQERVNFTPVIETPHGMTQAEVRMMYLWPGGGELTAAISLVRMGRGLMMGVDHNSNLSWVGGSAGLYLGR